MKELTKIALVNGYTLMTCWTSQEAGRYLEAYKQFERKPPDLIRERTDASYSAHMTAALTEVRGVNKTDVTTLMSSLGVRPCPLSLSLPLSLVVRSGAGGTPPSAQPRCLERPTRPLDRAQQADAVLLFPPPSLAAQTFAKIVTAPPSQLSALPGLGDKKVRRLREAFTAPFVLHPAGAKRRKVVGEAEKRGNGGERELN